MTGWMYDDIWKMIGSFTDKAQAVRKRELGAVFLDHEDVEQVAGSGRVGDQCKMAFCERIAVHDDAADVVGILGSGKKLFIEIVECIFLVLQHQNGLCLR